jgi:DNA primase
MRLLKDNTHKEYARYATHCLNMVASTKDHNLRCINRAMAAEWLKLADAALHPLKRTHRVRPLQYG